MVPGPWEDAWPSEKCRVRRNQAAPARASYFTRAFREMTGQAKKELS